MLNVQNPNAFAVPVQNLDAEIAIEGLRTASARLPAPVVLAASGDTRVELEASADAALITPLLARILRSGRVAYVIAGTAVLGDGRQLKYRREGELTGDLLGKLR